MMNSELRDIMNEVSRVSNSLEDKIDKKSQDVSLNNIETKHLMISNMGDIVDLMSLVNQSKDGRMSKEDKKKLDGIEAGSNKYIHPSTHPATMITTDSEHRFVTDVMISSWNNKLDKTGGILSGNLTLKGYNNLNPYSGAPALVLENSKKRGIIFQLNNDDDGYIHRLSDGRLSGHYMGFDYDSFVVNFEKTPTVNHQRIFHSGNAYSVPTPESDMSHPRFLRNNNTWATITPELISALPINGGEMKGIIKFTTKSLFDVGPQFQGATSSHSLNSRAYSLEMGWGYSGTVNHRTITDGFPMINDANGILTFNTHAGLYGHQIGLSGDGEIYHRNVSSGSFSKWAKLLSSENCKVLPALESADNKRYLRNDGTWHTLVPGDIEAYTKSEVDAKFSQLNSGIDWKEAVNTFDDLATTYPHPEDGWTVNVKDTDYTYRYTGSQWVAISANAIPNATNSTDGKMSKEDKAKLDTVERNANHYVHPANHPASMITTDSNHLFVTQAQIDSWNAKADAAGGSVDSANKWKTARTITLSGDATGSVSIDGSQNVTLPVTILDNSHNHTWDNITGKPSTFPPSSHGNHVPDPQSPDNAIFLRNDNTWQRVTPGAIGTFTKNEIDLRTVNRITLDHQEDGSGMVDYVKYVIGLVELDNSNINHNSHFDGIITTVRDNGLYKPLSIHIVASKRYNSSIMQTSMTVIGKSCEELRPCTFTYKGKKYGGLSIKVSDSLQYKYVFSIFTSKNSNPFVQAWYNTKENKVLNSEINSSIEFNNSVYMLAEHNHMTFNNQEIYHSGNCKVLPPVESSNNSRFLRNDGTWQNVTPGNIGAYTTNEVDNGFMKFRGVISADHINNTNLPNGCYDVRGTIANGIGGAGYYNLINYGEYENGNGGSHSQIAFPYVHDSSLTSEMFFRTAMRASWRKDDWCRVWHSNNLTPGLIDAYTKSEVLEKINEKFNVGTLDQWYQGYSKTFSEDINTFFKTRKTGFFCGTTLQNQMPWGGHSWRHYITTSHANSDGYTGIIGMNFNGDEIGFKCIMSGHDMGWKRIIHSGLLYINDRFTSSTDGILITQTDNQSGTICIEIPVGWNNTMMSFTVDVYNYVTSTSATIFISGYNYQNQTWYNTTAYLLSESETITTVRYGKSNSGNPCVYIGNDQQQWNYLQVFIRDVSSGFSGIIPATGWKISLVDQATNVQVTKSLGFVTRSYGRAYNLTVQNGLNVQCELTGQSASFLGDVSCDNLHARGKTYNAVWNDYAEYFPKESSTITEPGDIIALDMNSDTEVYTLASKDNSTVVGVHSDECAHLIGGENPPEDWKGTYEEYNNQRFIPVGLAGRVRVKITGPISKGSKVVLSDIPGVGREYVKGADDPLDIIGTSVENKTTDSIERVKIIIK